MAGIPVAGSIAVSADDFAAVYVNGQFAGQVGSVSVSSLALAAQSSLTTFDITSLLVQGQNTIKVLGQNGPFGDTSNYRGDPAGVVFGGSLEFQNVPEPTSLSLAGVACVILWASFRRLTRQHYQKSWDATRRAEAKQP